MKFKFKFVLIIAVFIFASTEAFSKVNDGGLGINLRGGFGGGQSLYAIGGDEASNSQVGFGEAGGYDFGMTVTFGLSFMSLAADMNIAGASLGDIEGEDTEKEEKYEQWGEGNMYFFDLRLGARLFTEPGDMGYTFLYVGLKSFGATYEMDKYKITYTDTNTSVEQEALQETGADGTGISIGFRDFSTYKMGPLSLVTILGFQYFKGEIEEKTEQGNTVELYDSETIGGQFEVGTGIALENLGMAFTLTCKGELVFNTHKEAKDAEEEAFGAGYLTVLLGATFEL